MRKPIHLESRGALSPRERIWAAARALRKFTLSELSRRSKVEHGTLATYARALERAGYIGRIGQVARSKITDRKETQYELMKDIGVEAPRLLNDGTPSFRGIGHEQMWRTMKILRQFNSAELALQSSTDEHQVAENEARGYLHYLALAGYVHPTTPADPRTGSKTIYTFVRSKNTGPKAPMLQAIKQVYDRNIGKVMYTPDPKEVEE